MVNAQCADLNIEGSWPKRSAEGYLSHSFYCRKQRLAFDRGRQEFLGTSAHTAKNQIPIGPVSSHEDIAVLIELDSFLNRLKPLLLNRSDIDDNDGRFHILDFVRSPTIESRIEIIELGSHLDEIGSLQQLSSIVPKLLVRTDNDGRQHLVPYSLQNYLIGICRPPVGVHLTVFFGEPLYLAGKKVCH